jgi:hypothetical protein
VTVFACRWCALQLLQGAKQLHTEEGVPYGDMAVLFRAFNSMGGKAHTHLQVCWSLVIQLLQVCWSLDNLNQARHARCPLPEQVVAGMFVCWSLSRAFCCWIGGVNASVQRPGGGVRACKSRGGARHTHTCRCVCRLPSSPAA